MDDDRARMSSSLTASLVVAVLLAATVQSPSLGLMLLPLLPVPFAIVTLRHGSVPVVAVTIGLAVAGVGGGIAFVGRSAGIPGLGLFMAGSCGALAWVLAECRAGRRFERAPTAVLTGGYLVLLGAVAALVAGSMGAGEIRTRMSHEVEQAYRPLLERCERAGRFSPSPETCAVLRDQAVSRVELIERHALAVLGPLLALTAVSSAVASLLALRLVAGRWGIPVAARRPLDSITVHWSIAYVLSAGLALMMAGAALGGGNHPLLVVGASLATLGGAAIVAQGAAVMAFYLARSRAHTVRVLVWVVALLTMPLSLGWFLALGIAEMLFGLRARTKSREGGGSG